MTLAQAKTACDDLVTAIAASDIDEADIKANTSSCQPAVLALYKALSNMVAAAGLCPRAQTYKGPLYP